jgi:HSP20 family protein
MKEQKDDQKKKDEGNVEIDFGIGKISFGGLFQGIGSLIDLVSKIEQASQEDVKHEGEFTNPSGQVKAVYGLSVKTTVGGKPTVESFGNVKRTPKGPVVEEERQPLVDVFDEKDHVVVIVELPGVEEKQISTKLEGDILTLSAAGGDRKYYKEVILPKDVDTGTLQSKYKNGVLEFRINKK